MRMKLGDWKFRAFHDGRFKFDGGAMFGVVPKIFWQKQHPADELNRIDLDLRCLLVENGDRRHLDMVVLRFHIEELGVTIRMRDCALEITVLSNMLR